MLSQINHFAAISSSEVITTPSAPIVLEESQPLFLQSLYAEDTDLGYGAPATYIDDMGTEVCPLTEVDCQAIFLNA